MLSEAIRTLIELVESWSPYNGIANGISVSQLGQFDRADAAVRVHAILAGIGIGPDPSSCFDRGVAHRGFTQLPVGLFLEFSLDDPDRTYHAMTGDWMQRVQAYLMSEIMAEAQELPKEKKKEPGATALKRAARYANLEKSKPEWGPDRWAQHIADEDGCDPSTVQNNVSQVRTWNKANGKS